MQVTYIAQHRHLEIGLTIIIYGRCPSVALGALSILRKTNECEKRNQRDKERIKLAAGACIDLAAMGTNCVFFRMMMSASRATLH